MKSPAAPAHKNTPAATGTRAKHSAPKAFPAPTCAARAALRTTNTRRKTSVNSKTSTANGLSQGDGGGNQRKAQQKPLHKAGQTHHHKQRRRAVAAGKKV